MRFQVVPEEGSLSHTEPELHQDILSTAEDSLSSPPEAVFTLLDVPDLAGLELTDTEEERSLVNIMQEVRPLNPAPVFIRLLVLVSLHIRMIVQERRQHMYGSLAYTLHGQCTLSDSSFAE